MFMSEFKMPSLSTKAEYVKDNFDIIASKYDLFNDLSSLYLHRLWKKRIIDIIKSYYNDKQIQCLDLCCGTGDISLRLSKLENANIVYSIDFSENMLSIAKSRLKNIPNSKLEIGDATNLVSIANESMDVVTVGFGLRNVNNLDKAISEIYRILKPGGIFINLDVGKVKNKFIRFFADFYFFKIVPIVGYAIYGKKNEMFDYLPVSSLYYPSQEELKVILENNKFSNVRYENFVFGNATLHFGVK